MFLVLKCLFAASFAFCAKFSRVRVFINQMIAETVSAFMLFVQRRPYSLGVKTVFTRLC